MNRTPFTIGLVLAGILALADIALLPAGGDYPPKAVAVGAAALGVATLVGIVLAWRGGRAGIWLVVACRVLSALSATPAFVVGDAPAAVVIVAGAILVITVAIVILVLPARRRVPAR